MAYVPDFEDDIFISYAHEDNQTIARAGWIEQLHAALEQAFVQKWGRAACPSIWRDPELRRNELFEETLSKELQKVAVIVSVLSPNYIESEWCKRELNAFRRAAEQRGGFKLNRKLRAFKVLKTHLDREQEPKELKGTTGYRFYKYDKATKRTTDFKLIPDDENLSVALNVIEDLANDIVEVLDELRTSKGPSVTESPTAAASPGLGIYLAETSLDLDEKRNTVKRELEARGHKVLPDGALPRRTAKEFEDAVCHVLRHCDLSIHMIGDERDHVLPGATRDIVCLQNELAAEYFTEQNLPRLIWLPVGLTPKDEEQRQFVDMLQTDPEAQRNAEVLKVDLQRFMTHVHDTLEKREKVPEKALETARPESVYVIAAEEDRTDARALGKHLFSQGFEWLKPLSESDATEEEMFEIHKRNLVDCDAAVVYWGKARESWFLTQMSELQRGVGWRHGRPMKARAVYLAPPKTDPKEDFLAHNFVVMRNYRDFSADALAPFLERLGKST
ncbi:MAG: toll/interleukin-1 receptor domain-containing protein [Myxococcales bacterium]|nr:toll/interleukin-1 receptor domain-containing protein [Myxococcales bacterium]